MVKILRGFRLLSIILLLFFYCKLFAQELNFINYDVDDGLAKSRVSAITQDYNGVMWFATQGGGISSFDGRTFKNFTVRQGLSNNFVRDITIDPGNRVWAGTYSGISLLDHDSVRNFEIFKGEPSHNSVTRLIALPGGEILFANPKGGIGLIASDSVLLINTGIRELDQFKVLDFELLEGKIYILSSAGGVYFSSDILHGLVDGPLDTKGLHILSIQANKDQLWLCSSTGLYSYNSNGLNLVKNANSFVNHAIEDRFGKVWTTSTGVLHPASDRIFFNSQDGFTDEKVNCMFKDREGVIWFGTDGNGVFKLTGEAIIKLSTGTGLPDDMVQALAISPKGEIWAGTNEGGITSLNHMKVIPAVTTLSELKGIIITALAFDSYGKLWIGSLNDGIRLFDGQVVKEIKGIDELKVQAIKCLLAGTDSSMWIGTTQGLYHYTNKQLIPVVMPKNWPETSVWHLYNNKDGELTAVGRYGFLVIDGEKSMTVDFPPIIAEKRVNFASFRDDHTMWLGFSGHGIGIYDLISGNLKLIDTSDGLSSDIVHGLVDLGDRFLVATDRGIDKLVELKDGSYRVRSFQGSDGFKGVQTSYGAMVVQGDSVVWFGSNHGIFVYRKNLDVDNSVPPLMIMTKVSHDYQPLTLSTINGNYKTGNKENPLVLPYGVNNLLFEFKGISHIAPEKIRYQYRLDNFNEEWSPSSGVEQASFTNLSPGNYVFRVRASNGDGTWSENDLEFHFYIVPPIWVRPWFYIILIVLIGLFIYVYNSVKLRKRVKQVLEIEKIRAEEQTIVRKRMARDFHDNMGNQLASITVFANLISLKLKNQPADIHQLLDNIQKHTTSLFNGTKDFIWSMDPSSENPIEIFTYLRDFGEELYDSSTIGFYAENTLNDQTLPPLPSGSGRQVVSIFKEAMTNVMKHSGATKCWFGLNLEQGNLVFFLRDNGKGIAEKTREGNGLGNMQYRAKEAGLHLELKNDDGLIVRLTGKMSVKEAMSKT